MSDEFNIQAASALMSTETKLAELRAKRAALQAAREAGEAERAEARAIAAEEQALLDEVALGEAIDKHGDVGVGLATVQTPMGLIIIKKATAMRFQRFQDKGNATTEDVRQLVSPCLVHPSPAQFSVILEELPATLIRLASQVIALAGQESEATAKK